MKSKTWEVGQEAGKVFGEEYFFVVNPLTINQKLFEKKRRNKEQEELRYWIQLAFEEVEANPEKYGQPFETYVPKKTWEVKTGYELEEMAEELGGYNGDWIEQALVFAQRIANGESWRDICNSPDEIQYSRWVIGESYEDDLLGLYIDDNWIVGGGRKSFLKTWKEAWESFFEAWNDDCDSFFEAWNEAWESFFEVWDEALESDTGCYYERGFSKSDEFSDVIPFVIFRRKNKTVYLPKD